MLFELLKNAKKVAATKPKASSTTKPADRSTKDKKGLLFIARASRIYRPRPRARPRGHGELLKLLRPSGLSGRLRRRMAGCPDAAKPKLEDDGSRVVRGTTGPGARQPCRTTSILPVSGDSPV